MDRKFSKQGAQLIDEVESEIWKNILEGLNPKEVLSVLKQGHKSYLSQYEEEEKRGLDSLNTKGVSVLIPLDKEDNARP